MGANTVRGRTSSIACMVAGGGVLALAMNWAAPAVAQATDMARVVASVPVVEQVAVPQTRCEMRQVLSRPEPSGGGALAGAVVGGLLGSSFGQGSGQLAAAALGAAGGALLGDRSERDAMPAVTQPVQECHTVQAFEPRTVGWNVTYEFAGRQQAVRLPYDPGVGAHLPVRIDLVQSAGATLPPSELPVSPAPIAGGVPVPTVVQPATVVTTPYPYPFAGAVGYPPLVVVRPWPVVPAPWVGFRAGWGVPPHGGHRHHGGYRPGW